MFFLLDALKLNENEWEGSTENWDIEINGSRICVRRERGEIVLSLRLDPPGRVVVERLDMRVEHIHILATERTYAIGRYLSNGTIVWVHANIQVNRATPRGAIIEFTDPEILETRDLWLRGTGQELANDNRTVVINSSAGIMIKPLGIVIASMCGAFSLVELAIGSQLIDEMRRIVFNNPDYVAQYIATGTLADP